MSVVLTAYSKHLEEEGHMHEPLVQKDTVKMVVIRREQTTQADKQTAKQFYKLLIKLHHN